MELADIEICRQLHQLRYFGNYRSIMIEGETLTASGSRREYTDKMPIIKPPRLHEVSDWLRAEKGISIRIECRPRTSHLADRQSETIWRYRVYYDKGREHLPSKGYYNQYGWALEAAIIHALTLIHQ